VINDLIALPYAGTTLTAVFKIVNEFIPDILWVVFFFLLDLKGAYYVLYMLISGLGCFLDFSFFSLHLLDIAMRSSVLGYVLLSVFSHGDQVLYTYAIHAYWMYTLYAHTHTHAHTHSFIHSYIHTRIHL
jgi:hypothetical protein